jgi:WD40 repeat protein
MVVFAEAAMNAAWSKSLFLAVALRARMSEAPLRALLLVSLLGAIAAADEPPRTDLYGDPLPAGAIARLGTMRLTHNGGSNAIVFSPDGKTIASACGQGDKSVRLWDVVSGKLLWRIDLEAYSLAFSPDGRWLACGAVGGKSGILDARTGAVLQRIDEDRDVEAVAIAPDGATAVFAALDLKVVRTGDGSILQRWNLRGMRSQAAAFSPDGKRIAIGGRGEYALFDAASGDAIRRWRTDWAQVSYLAFSPADGRLFTVTSDITDSALHAWDGESGEPLGTLETHPRQLHDLVVTPDGRWLAICRRNEHGGDEVVVHDLERGTAAPLLTLRSSSNRLAISPDGSKIATSGSRIRFWDRATGKENGPFPSGAWIDPYCEFSPDGKYFASCNQIWVTARGEPLNKAEDADGAIFSKTGEPLLLREEGNKLQVTSPTSPGQTWEVPGGRFWIAPSLAYALCVSSSSLELFAKENFVELWDLSTPRLVWRNKSSEWRSLLEFTSDTPAKPFIVSYDGKKLARLRERGDVELIDIATGEKDRLKPFEEKWYAAYRSGVLSFSPSGNALVVAYPEWERPQYIWNIGRGQSAFPVSEPFAGRDWRSAIPWIGFSSTRNEVVLHRECRGRNDDPFLSQFRSYDLSTGELRNTVSIHRARDIADFALTRSGDSFYGALPRRFIRIGSYTSDLDIQPHFRGRAFAGAPNGEMLFQATDDWKAVNIWETATAKLLATLRIDTPYTARVLIPSRDGRYFLTSLANGTALVWDLDTYFSSPAVSQKTPEELWQLLASDDAVTARRAMQAALEKRQEFVEFCFGQTPPFAPDATEIDKLISSLDSNTFSMRQAATDRLISLGEVAIGKMSAALKEPRSAEQKARLTRLLASADGPIKDKEIVRFVRALQVLERTGTPAARECIRKFSLDNVDPRIAQRASRALDRLTTPAPAQER